MKRTDFPATALLFLLIINTSKKLDCHSIWNPPFVDDSWTVRVMVTPQDALCTTSSSSPSATPCQFYLLLENSRKSNNLGPILRCAAAFGIHTVVAVGYDKCSVDGSHGASKHVRIIAFPLAEQAAAFLREECQCQSLIGLLGCLPDGYAEKGYPVQYNCCDDYEFGSMSRTLDKNTKDNKIWIL